MLGYFSLFLSSVTEELNTFTGPKIQEYVNAIRHIWEIKFSPVFLVDKEEQECNITKLSQSQQEPLDFLFTFPCFSNRFGSSNLSGLCVSGLKIMGQETSA